MRDIYVSIGGRPLVPLTELSITELTRYEQARKSGNIRNIQNTTGRTQQDVLDRIEIEWIARSL